LRFVLMAGSALLVIVLGGGCQPSVSSPGPDSTLVQSMNEGVSLMGQYHYDAAAKAFERAVAAAPHSLEAKLNLAIALFNRGRKEDNDLERGSQLLEEVLAKDPQNLRALYSKGILLQHLGKAEEAIPCFEQAVRQRPQDGAAWYLLGLCKSRLGQPAEQELLRAVSLRPGLYSAYYQLYQSALRAGDSAKAKEYIEKFKAIRESPLAESIELPQYNQMGDLALALPLEPQPRSASASRFQAGAARELFVHAADLIAPTDGLLGGVAAGDLNRDGHVDLILTSAAPGGPGGLLLLRGNAGGRWAEATAGSGLETVRQALSCAVGDFDNDEKPDLLIACTGACRLFRGNGDGSFTDVTLPAGLAGVTATNPSALFLDADHDADLDILICNAGSTAGQPAASLVLLNNNGDGSFTNITDRSGLAGDRAGAVTALPGDLDGDRDADLVVLRAGAPARVFLNDLSGRYRAAPHFPDVRGDRGGALQDFSGDGQLDLLALGGQPPALRLYLGDGRGGLRVCEPFEATAKALTSLGSLSALRVADADLDGDLDVAVFGQGGPLLLNVGGGKFTLQPNVWPAEQGAAAGVEWLDLTGDFVPDLLRVDSGARRMLRVLPGQLSPPSTALAVLPTGARGRDGRTRSPASGYGVKAVARSGLHEQSVLSTGQSGGPNQSWLPLALGLAGAGGADFVQFHWPDGVMQVEIGLSAGQTHTVAELQRKISSCPVLFAWNGQRYAFVTDFAGVGGLGYYAGPGECAQPQVLEHVKIEPEQLVARDGVYELRVTEPMEETAYIDRLELLALDHPRGQRVFPDERLSVSGPPPTHELLALASPIFPSRAWDARRRDCTERIRHADRLYAYEPPLDPRYYGFCRPHTLELDFADRLASPGSNEPVFLFIRGSIEFPYSQTVYAAAQSSVRWESLRIERLNAQGGWETLVPDAGAPGGTDRTMTIDLTGRLSGGPCVLRLTTNLELYYDQIFLARNLGARAVSVRSVPMLTAALRSGGFAREYSPDGRKPRIYDYHASQPAAPFHVLRGAYTRYGPVQTLLQAFDDQYVLVGPGDEIALRFDAAKLPALAPDLERSFVLVSHAYCKDMDLYTATPQTLEPLPFRGMSRYPPGEPFPDTAELRAYRATYNTRIVD
jgi:Tfp pilus assembly protein PilF